MTAPLSPPTPAEIAEACELLRFAVKHCHSDFISDAAFRGSAIALTWVRGDCDCGCRQNFHNVLVHLRAQHDQADAGHREGGGHVD